VWFQFNWDLWPNGKVWLSQSPQQVITITNQLELPQPIKCLKPQEAHRYLGVYLTMDGNYKQELNVFWQRNDNYIWLLWNVPFSHWEVWTVYLQCYLPTFSYPLPATTMPSHIIHNAQKKATSIFLAKCGYLWTYPWAIAYASTEWGGLRFRQLSHKATIQQCLQFLKHIQLINTIGKVLKILIQHYQFASSLAQLVLKDTCTIPWSNAPWMDHLQLFLWHIQGQIVLQTTWISKPRQMRDQHIMDNLLTYNLPTNQLIQINSVWLYLQVNLLSEIVDHTRQHILPTTLKPSKPPEDSTYQLQHSGLAQANQTQTDCLEKVERNDTLDIHPAKQHYPYHTFRPMASALFPRLRMGLAYSQTYTNSVPSPPPHMVWILDTATTPQHLDLQQPQDTLSKHPHRHDTSNTHTPQPLHRHITTHHTDTSCRPSNPTPRTYLIPKNHHTANNMGPAALGPNSMTRTDRNTTQCPPRR